MRRIGAAVFAAVFVLVIGFYAFAAGGREQASGDEAKTVTMWTFLDPEGATGGRNLALARIIEDFEEQNPGVEIVVEPKTWSTMTTAFLAAHEAGNAPDIQWVIMDQLGEAIQANALTPFEELFLDDMTEEEIADFADAFWDYGAEEDRHYQISLSRNYIGLVYRQDLFDQLGIQAPLATWNDLIEAGRLLTGTDGQTGVERWGLGLGYATEQINPPMAVSATLARQGDIFDSDGSAKWATDAGIEALTMETEFVTRFGIAPEDSVALSGEDLQQEFAAGRFGMISMAGVRMGGIRSHIAVADPQDVEFMLLPGWEDGQPSPGIISGWAVAVWSGSKVKEEAGAFVRHLFSPEADRLWVELGDQVPVRSSTIEAMPEFFSDPANRYLRVMAQGFRDAGYAIPANITAGGWRQDWAEAAQDVLVNGTDPGVALQRAEDRFNRRHNR